MLLNVYIILKKMIFILYKIYNIKMSIRQDWEPVIISNGKNKKINNNNNNKRNEIDEEEEGGMTKKVQKFTIKQIDALKEARILQKISQKDLAKKLNIDSKIIQDIEQNNIPFNKLLYRNIMKVLKIDDKTITSLLNEK
jgi:ribosome-binding protein aMBF1 (putative translation factor)